MSPTQHRKQRNVDLCLSVRQLHALKSAWDHVKLSALKSRSNKTRAAATKFLENETSRLRELQEELRQSDFKFETQDAFLKKRAGKTPRPLLSATIRDRIVQRAILNVCQSESREIKSCLGNLPLALETRTSVGGIRGKGPAEAARLIAEAIESGATHYIRSDLKDFFTRIPKDAIAQFLNTNIADKKFNKLFMSALEIELANEAEVREWISLFPRGNIGVAQGSALSALCANIILSTFDEKLNGRGIVTIRYLDDFVIVGPSKADVEKAWLQAISLLDAVGMEAHDPKGNSAKAANGRIEDGFDFLSYCFRGKQIFPSSSARREFLNDLRRDIVLAKREIFLMKEISFRRSQDSFVQFLALLDRQIRGWGDAFAATNQRLVFIQLDKEISKIIGEFRRWFNTISKDVDDRCSRRLLGIALLVDTPVSNKQRNRAD